MTDEQTATPASAPSPQTTTVDTPAATSSAAPVTTEPSSVVANESDPDFYSGFSKDIEDILGEPKAPAAPAPDPALAAPKASEAPVAQPVAPVPPPVPAAPQAQAPASEAATPQPQPQRAEGIDGVLGEIKGQEAQLLEQISASFALSPEDVSALELDAVGHTPKLLAKTYLRSVETSLQYMKTLIPSMVERRISQMKQEMEVENAFFSKFPAIQKDAHGKDVVAFASAFRAANPNITRDELFARVGAAVMAQYNLTAAAKPPAPAPLTATQRMLNGTQVASAPGFAPASSGVVTHQQPVQSSPWDGIGQEFE